MVVRHYVFNGPKRIKLTGAKFELILKDGEDFFLIDDGSTFYVTHDRKTLEPKLRLSKANVNLLLAASSKWRKPVGDKEISVQRGPISTPSNRLTDDQLKARIQAGQPAPPSDHVIQFPKPTLTKRKAERFLAQNKARIISGFKKNLARVLEARHDNSAEHIKVSSTQYSISVGADIILPNERYANLQYRLSITPTGYVAVSAYVSVEHDTPKLQLVFRSTVVKDFYTNFLAMRKKLLKTFDLPEGVTIGPLSMKSNLVVPYLAVSRYLLTRV